MSLIWILVAFLFGFVARQMGLPPLVGYLCAGFALHAYGVVMVDELDVLAELGITLLLFTIGLKINIKELMRIDIWGSAASHMSSWIVLVIPLLVFSSVLFSASYLEMDMAAAAVIALAMSFSSTVCAVKVLEDSSELKTRHSDLSISVLIIQDIVAVLFLVFATGKVPSLWAIALLGLVFIRPLVSRLFSASGHGELIPLLGFVLAIGGAELFKLVNLKGDLGALAMGMLLAGMPKANELYKSLMGFKDLFLIGFFLTIGFTALPTMDIWFIVGLFLLVVPLKFMLFFSIFLFFSFRARTAFLSALLLSNFSEFGLIVISISAREGWVQDEWLIIIALAAAMSFALNTFLYKHAHAIYTTYKGLITRFERKGVAKSVVFEQPEGAEVLVVGMGRVGLGAYTELLPDYGDKLWGIEVDKSRVDRFKMEGKNVVQGDGDDIDFWETIKLDQVRLIMLAIPSVTEMKNIVYQLKQTQFSGKIAAIARFDDERSELLKLGADVAFNYYAEVGTGFADESRHLLKDVGSTKAGA